MEMKNTENILGRRHVLDILHVGKYTSYCSRWKRVSRLFIGINWYKPFLTLIGSNISITLGYDNTL